MVSFYRYKSLILIIAAAFGLPSLIAVLLTWLAPETSVGHNVFWALALYSLSLSAFGVAATLLFKSRVRAEDLDHLKTALQESERKFFAIAESAQIGVYVLQDGKVVYGNPKMGEIFGYPSEEVVGIKLTTGIHPEDLPLVKENLRRRMAGETVPPNMVYRGLKRTGEVILFNAYSAAISYEGRPAVAGMLTDITEERRIEQALVESEARFRAVVKNSPAVIWQTDAEGHIVLGEGQMLARLGLRPNQFHGMLLYEVFRDYPSITGHVRKALAGEIETAEYITPMQGVEGEVIFKTSQTVLRDPSGAISGTLGISVDITDKMRTEEELQRLLREKEMLLREMHHRTKNNLMVIQSLLNLQSGALRDEGSKSALRESGKRIRSISLLHDMLSKAPDLKDINAKKYLEDIVRGAFESCKPEGDRIVLRTVLGEVSLALESIVPLGIIINELVTNSLKYAFPGGRSGLIEVSVWEARGEVRVTVRDNGVGLPAGFTLEEPHKSFGMKVIGALVQQIDGELEARSEGGAVFLLRFKGHKALGQEEGIMEKDTGTAAGKQKRYKLLLVEDDRITQGLMGKVLDRLGYACTMASTGREAIDVFRPDLFDLVLMDIELPDMKGTEIAADLRRQGCHSLPIIALTGHAREDVVALALKHGINDVLTKPVEMATLKGLLETHLGNA